MLDILFMQLKIVFATTSVKMGKEIFLLELKFKKYSIVLPNKKKYIFKNHNGSKLLKTLFEK